MAAFVLTVALMSLLAALTQSADVRKSAQDGEVAAQLLRAELERYRALPMEQVTTSILNASPAGQPSAVSSEPDLPSGTLTAQMLTEQECVTAFGLAQAPDLDGDGDPDVSTPASYRMVPLRITLTWDAGGATRSRQVTTFFYPRSTGS